jgi:hypothetical protein
MDEVLQQVAGALPGAARKGLGDRGPGYLGQGAGVPGRNKPCGSGWQAGACLRAANLGRAGAVSHG